MDTSELIEIINQNVRNTICTALGVSSDLVPSLVAPLYTA